VYRLLTFDAVGTLFRARGSVGSIYASAARDLGFVREAGAFRDAFRSAFAAMPPLAFPGASEHEIRACERAWWADLVGRVLDLVAAPSGFDRGRYFDRVYTVFASAKGWELYDDVLQALDAVAAAGLRMGIVSNFDARCRAVCEALGIARYFQDFTLSSEAGVAKPDPGIFAAALRAHGVRAGEAVHVGDHPILDVMAARALGMKGVLVDRRDGTVTPGGVTRITSLAELSRHVG